MIGKDSHAILHHLEVLLRCLSLYHILSRRTVSFLYCAHDRFCAALVDLFGNAARSQAVHLPGWTAALPVIATEHVLPMADSQEK